MRRAFKRTTGKDMNRNKLKIFII